MQAGQGHFGGRHEVVIFFDVFVEVIGELGQLPGGQQGFGLHHEGGVFFQVALADVQVEHPGDQRALQTGARAAEHVKARTGDFDAPFEIDDAQLRTQVPVRFRGEIEFGFRSPTVLMTIFSLSSTP